jgi:UDP-N-acetylmuramoyl-tripeptide--D-alanyl-D-alanine ligase
VRDGQVAISHPDGETVLRPSFAQAHNLRNLLAAVAAAHAVGVRPRGELEVSFSAGRGERVQLGNGVVLVNDCYNANPMSMRAALDDLVQTQAARRIAVLGDMLELGPQELDYHRQIGAHAAAGGVDLLITVGPRAAVMAETFRGEVQAAPDAEEAVELLRRRLRAGDAVLVKASNGVGLQRVAAALSADAGPIALAEPPADPEPAAREGRR